MLKLVLSALADRNYRTSDVGREKSREDAKYWIERAREHFGVGAVELDAGPRPARIAAAWALHRWTTQPQRWIAERLGLHRPANVGQQVRCVDSGKRPAFATTDGWRRWEEFVSSR